MFTPGPWTWKLPGTNSSAGTGKRFGYDLTNAAQPGLLARRVRDRHGTAHDHHLAREEWSVHYNISPDGKLFAGDGGGPNSVANRSHEAKPLQPPGNGQWIYLFRPEPLRMTGSPDSANRLIRTGVLRSERLVDLSRHDYRLEPNVQFTPDGKWIVFRSNMHGATHVYAVEVARSGKGEAGE